jgi:hypothetical protein
LHARAALRARGWSRLRAHRARCSRCTATRRPTRHCARLWTATSAGRPRRRQRAARGAGGRSPELSDRAGLRRLA